MSDFDVYPEGLPEPDSLDEIHVAFIRRNGKFIGFRYHPNKAALEHELYDEGADVRSLPNWEVTIEKYRRVVE